MKHWPYSRVHVQTDIPDQTSIREYNSIQYAVFLINRRQTASVKPVHVQSTQQCRLQPFIEFIYHWRVFTSPQPFSFIHEADRWIEGFINPYLGRAVICAGLPLTYPLPPSYIHTNIHVHVYTCIWLSSFAVQPTHQATSGAFHVYTTIPWHSACHSGVKHAGFISRIYFTAELYRPSNVLVYCVYMYGWRLCFGQSVWRVHVQLFTGKVVGLSNGFLTCKTRRLCEWSGKC